VSKREQGHLVEILCALSDHEVQFVVAGGVAMVLHGIERMTLDLDIAVSLDPENLQRFLLVLRDLQLIPRAPVAADIILEPRRIHQLIQEKNALVFTFWNPGEPYRQVDMFLTRENSFDDLVSDAQAIPIRGHRILVASRRKLIEMKSRVQPIREKDVNDIRALTQIEQSKESAHEGKSGTPRAISGS
jgi:hypothetical protein